MKSSVKMDQGRARGTRKPMGAQVMTDHGENKGSAKLRRIQRADRPRWSHRLGGPSAHHRAELGIRKPKVELNRASREGGAEEL